MLYLGDSLTAAGAQVIKREEGNFVKFIKKEDSCLLIKLLRVLKKDTYWGQINDSIIWFWLDITTLVG